MEVITALTEIRKKLTNQSLQYRRLKSLNVFPEDHPFPFQKPKPISGPNRSKPEFKQTILNRFHLALLLTHSKDPSL